MLNVSACGIRIDRRSNGKLFAGLKSLTVLHASYNCISWLPSDLFVDQSNLTILYLNHNGLSGWGKKAFSHIKNPLSISLKNNNLEIVFDLPPD